ncbi:MAG: non-canonical purine NTP pyrophosphatase, RdgB/HAM1 family [Gammaproteobacteria bacterium RIFCSPHIGHO2_12_FULL_45_12]|nr:MAG: non-canonical purine NTP pyrophosphatase, RdgB/HAM1 family [Gammaproteobacteria bacterium RIFCSPHIGHO2_12_FULL_45_12]
MKVVLASSNAGKIREFKALLHAVPVTLIPQAELGVTDVAETGLTFIENALIKARHAACETGLPALSDDSGIAVRALKGAPGIYSARYAGVGASAKDNIQKLLTDMKNIADENRQASFHCILAFMRHDQDPTPLLCDGEWTGLILRQPQGQGGHGYDPVFYVPEENKTAAELPCHRKNTLSHRGKAFKQLLAKLSDTL